MDTRGREAERQLVANLLDRSKASSARPFAGNASFGAGYGGSGASSMPYAWTSRDSTILWRASSAPSQIAPYCDEISLGGVIKISMRDLFQRQVPRLRPHQPDCQHHHGNRAGDKHKDPGRAERLQHARDEE